jgi:hypothetical protein
MSGRKRIFSLGLRDPMRLAPRWLRTVRSIGYASVRRLTRHSDDGGIQLPLPPPVCPVGWRTGPPDFVGVGVQRCGTTRWIHLIASHPQVDPPPVVKEVHYFDRFYAGGFTANDVAGYHKYFPRDGDRKVGEWTPLYMSAPWVPKLLARAAPDARLLVLLRDPVERYLSSLQHDISVASEYGAPLSRLAPLDAFVRGLYHVQLTGLLAYFERSQILVLQYERCTYQPLAELQRTFAFLGLQDTEFAPDLTANPHHQPEKPKLDPEALDAYVQAYREDVIGLARAFPEIDLRLWPNFAHLAAKVPGGEGR